MNLVIVESPTKAKTISRFLKRSEFKITSSFGHVRDLPKKGLGIDVENNFEPEYVITEKAEKTVKELKKVAKDANLIILATDEDREGEAISWHLVSALNLKNKKTQRITFHEITKTAIEKALKNPREIDINLVNAQQARRILDRLVGYKLSPLLWSKIRLGLSAGRVQSVAVRLIVEREDEIKAFEPQEFWEINAQLKSKINPEYSGQKSKTEEFEARLWKENNEIIKKLGIKTKEHADKIKNFLEKAILNIEKINKKEVSKNPFPPYITSTLQQAANSYLGYSAKQTMRIAQQLYEGIALENKRATGLITYMRTDSLSLSKEAVAEIRTVIKEKFGEKYVPETAKIYKTKSKGAQEAHEAIRPTSAKLTPEYLQQFLDSKQYRLYKLIWDRTVASQMASAKMDSTSVEIKATQKNENENYWLKATGSIIKFDGYLALTGSKREDAILPELKENETVDLIKINSEQKETQPPSRYSEATLVKVLEEHGIGRPSTYAPTISTIQDRGYVEKDENKKLFPTETGVVVNTLLVKHFDKIVDYEFTAELEKHLDEIAEGKKEWTTVIKNFYKPFMTNLNNKDKEIQKQDFQKKLDKKCPQCKSDLVEKFGRFGKFIACSNYPECKYTEKTFEDKKQEKEIQKQEGGKGGKIICEKCGKEMEVKRGRFGMFIGCTGYPECKNIKKVENKTGITCPKCGKDIVERKSKKGRVFFGCNGYPKCDFAVWNKPTGEKCPKCKSLLVLGAKDTIQCSNKECDFKKDSK